MKAKLIKINPDNPQLNRIEEVVNILKKGGVIIYPTDTVYGIGCDIYSVKAVERICKLRDIDPSKINLSFICYDLSDISTYTASIDKSVYKVMKKAFPGPFTFILPASKMVPRVLYTKKKSVGIRVPDHNIPRMIVKELDSPIVTASLKDDEDNVMEYLTDPELIFEKYGDLVDAVIDGGVGGIKPSTIVDFTGKEIEILREGLGDIEKIF